MKTFHYVTENVYSHDFRGVIGTRRVKVNHPFGYIARNGMNFASSVKNPKSRLSRLVNYLRENTHRNVSKVDILNDVFYDGRVNGGKKFTSNNRGWGAFLFAGARHCGFVKYTRVGNHGYWTVGKNAHKVV